MYSKWFYYILMFFTLSFILRLIGPLLIPALIIYLVYTFLKNRETIKTVKDLHKAKKTFKQEWTDVTQSEEFNQSSSDVIDAQYTVKED